MRTQDDLDVDAGLAEEAQAVLDLAPRDAAPVREGRQPGLDDLALARPVRGAVRDPDDRVDPRVVGKNDPDAVPGLEAADDPLPGALEDADHDARAAVRASAPPARRGP